ncbi:hypothetical protein J6590_048648 [Homalodisca vitripennis]|nr:hypothetical protein J6590_048648 [Homalodisca vitripennis]
MVTGRGDFSVCRGGRHRAYLRYRHHIMNTAQAQRSAAARRRRSPQQLIRPRVVQPRPSCPANALH